jgi:hypothetical protein
MEVLRDVVVPVGSAYVLMAAVVLYAARHPGAGGPPPAEPGWAPRLRLVGLTVGGGYVAFLGIVLVFHVWVVGQRGAMASALRGGTFLAVVCALVFVAASLWEARRATTPVHPSRPESRSEREEGTGP